MAAVLEGKRGAWGVLELPALWMVQEGKLWVGESDGLMGIGVEKRLGVLSG